MQTIEEHFREANKAGFPCSYFGDNEDASIVLVRTRDSDNLEESNFEVARKLLEEIDEAGVFTERVGHWFCGWMEYLLIDSTNKALVEKASEFEDCLSEYSALDDDDFFEREYNDYWTVIEDELHYFFRGLGIDLETEVQLKMYRIIMDDSEDLWAESAHSDFERFSGEVKELLIEKIKENK